MSARNQGGALAGLRVVEFAAKGPVPLCGMLLADMGAQVTVVGRMAGSHEPSHKSSHKPDKRYSFVERGKRMIDVDLKNPQGVEVIRRMIAGADVVIEGFRPGVMERLGLGPERFETSNPGLVYARVTGWGQDGPLAQKAGHDINFIALTGILSTIGSAESGPVPPLNLVADYAGGSLYAALGITSALLERSRSGQGQVIDVAMTDGVLSLMTALLGIRARGDWKPERGSNFLDGGAPWYGVYQCADGQYIAVGALEDGFRQAFFDTIGLTPEDIGDDEQPAGWPRLRTKVAMRIAGASRDTWMQRFSTVDACVTAVNSLEEALEDPALAARASFVEVDGQRLPAVAPRLMRTPGHAGKLPLDSRVSTPGLLGDLGFEAECIAELMQARVVR